MQELRDIAKVMFSAAVERADPARALRMQLEKVAPHSGGKVFVLAVGKAAVPMMREALVRLPRVDEALAVTNSENLASIDGARVMTGAHPVPDGSSATAGQAVVEMLQRARKGGQVVALISGGGSALIIAPDGDITVDDYARTNAILLASGLGINDFNLIRQQIDSLKGGGLLRLAAPAEVHGYLLSDVIGDDLCAIASGPTVAPLGTCEDAVRLLQTTGLWQRMPQTVQAHLTAELPKAQLPLAINHLIGSNRQSLEAMLEAAPADFDVQIASHALVGDVTQAAEEVLRCARAAAGPAALIFGGETTVQLRGTGRGGRNQELALRVACGAQGVVAPGWVFLSAGTDGRDGPTDAAGGIVDADTVARIVQAGGDPGEFLKNNDSYTALQLAGDLLFTGGTDTNVADVQVFLRPVP